MDKSEPVKAVVQRAMREMDDYLQAQVEKYQERQAWRRRHAIPAIAVCGHGMAGKDLSATYLCTATSMQYGGSTSTAAAPFIAHAMGQDTRTAFESRRDNRQFWYDFCCEMRRHDPTLLARLNLAEGDIVVGLRDATELHDCVRRGLVDLTIWVDRDVEPDPTIKFTADDCHITITNNGSGFELYRKWDKIVDTLCKPYFSYKSSISRSLGVQANGSQKQRHQAPQSG